MVKVSQSLVGDVGVAVNIGGGSTGVDDPTGVDGSVGVGVSVSVGVGELPRTLSPVPVEGRSESTLSPLETRTVHSSAVCPACRPFTSKVNAVPLVVALLLLLPAIATMKLPFCGPLMAVTGSAPKRLVLLILLDSTRLSSYVQVNSALVYSFGGTLFKLTVTNALSSILILVGLTSVKTNGPDGVVEVAVSAVGVGVGVVVEGVGVFVSSVVGVVVGVGVGGESITFKSGLNNPSVSPFFVKVVLFRTGR